MICGHIRSELQMPVLTKCFFRSDRKVPSSYELGTLCMRDGCMARDRPSPYGLEGLFSRVDRGMGRDRFSHRTTDSKGYIFSVGGDRLIATSSPYELGVEVLCVPCVY